jgi:cupin fold WbuC family metalloprotein
MSSSHKLALPPPDGALTILGPELVEKALAYSRQSPRRRVIQPFHKTEADTLHRMFNAVQPDSYIRPHRHLDPPKAEAWIVLAGSLAFFTFEDDGRVRDCLRLAANSAAFGVDLVAGVYHTFVALEPDTLIYEVKPGPYAPSNDKAFGPWAPAEGTPEAPAYQTALLREFERRDAARA